MTNAPRNAKRVNEHALNCEDREGNLLKETSNVGNNP